MQMRCYGGNRAQPYHLLTARCSRLWKQATQSGRTRSSGYTYADGETAA
ncbi:hypothetical protein [Nostoc sp. ChiSLP03a]|nr:hypothetical protein [Nostoc sp. ChiSLP03a]MDZ8216105.1 hypothetical protein [Nostoc sp. ChiSLP03a]